MTYQNGVVSYQAWYEWYPAYAYNFNNFPINSGDVLKLTVTAYTTTSGIAIIENLTTNQQVSQQLSSSYALCEQNAEWIVEDYSQGGRLVPLCNFGTVAFTNSYATTSTGSQITPNGATIIDMEQKRHVLTSVSENSNGVTITYV